MHIYRCFACVFGLHHYGNLLNGLWKFILCELHKILGRWKPVPKWYPGKKWPNLSRAKLFCSSPLFRHNWASINLPQVSFFQISTWTLLWLHYSEDALWNILKLLSNISQKNMERCIYRKWQTCSQSSQTPPSNL